MNKGVQEFIRVRNDVISAINKFPQERREPYWEPVIENFKKGVEARKNKDWDVIYEEFMKLGNELINLYGTLPENLWKKPIWQDKKETVEKFLEEDISHWRDEHLVDFKQKTD